MFVHTPGAASGYRLGNFSFLYFTSRSSTASRKRTAFAIRVSLGSSSSRADFAGSRYKDWSCFTRLVFVATRRQCSDYSLMSNPGPLWL
jgi:hypothetical protein